MTLDMKHKTSMHTEDETNEIPYLFIALNNHQFFKFRNTVVRRKVRSHITIQVVELI